jgi:hypothetical protein
MFFYKNIGCEVRILKELTFPLITFGVYDDKAVQLNFYTPSQREGSMLVKIEDKETTHLLKEIFNQLWKKAQPIK